MKYKILCTFFLIFIHSFAQNKNQSIGFKENKGQIIDQKGKPNPDVKYLLNTNGLNVQIKTNGFSYDIYETKKHPLTEKQKAKLQPSSLSENDKEKGPDYTLEYIYHRIDIDFVNSNPKVELLTEQKSKDYDNYYNVPNKPEGVLMVHQYKQITYKNIYPNIDIVFSIPKDSLKAVEYNFVVHPNGKISDIQLKFNGAKTDLVDNKIRMQVRFGEMEETLPMSWTEDGKSKKEVAVGYKKIKNNIYGFASAQNISNKTVIIDPVPTRLWGTYYGGNSLNLEINSINTDSQENVVMTGETHSSDNIATLGAFITTNNDYTETGFIVKFNSIGQRIWGSYIKNGNLGTNILDCKINSGDHIYIAGKAWDGGNGTNSIATPNSHKQTPSILGPEGFILKLDSNGIREWGTFFGGDHSDYINSIVLDNQENLIISGITNSNNGIATQNSFLPNFPLSSTFYPVGFFCKFSPSGSLLYGSYYYVPINKIVKDLNNNYYFSGIYGNNNDYPKISTIGSHQEQNYLTDVYLTKFNSNFNQEWCTYYGGNSTETLSGIGTDNQSNIYLVGNTYSIENISTPGAYKEVLLNNALNTFIVKFNASGQRIFGTYFGRNESISDDKSEDCYISENGNIYLGGTTRIYQNATDLSTVNSFQVNSNGSDEGFFTKFDSTGHLIWCSYYGTPSQDYIQKVYYKKHLYIAGYSSGVASNGNDLGTSGTHMPVGGGYLTFVAKFQDCISNPVISSNSPICIGNTLNLKASGGTNYAWTGPNGFTSTNQNPIITNATLVNSGQYSCAITGTGGCDDTKTVNVIVGDVEPPTPNLTILPSITGDCNTIITIIPTATDTCAGVITATTTSPLSYSMLGTYTIVWNYIDGNGNSVNQNQTVTINSQPLPNTTSPQIFCIQQNATISSIAITGQNIKWYDALTNGNSLATKTLLQNGVTYFASQTINGCESDRIPVLINIQNTAAPTAISSQTFCASQNPTLNTIAITGNAIKWYDNSTLGNLLPISTPLINGKTYYATQTLNACESPTRLAVTVALISTLPANNYAELFCDDLNDGSETVNLSSYNSSIISNDTYYNFSYYNSLSGAQNETAANKISNFTNYKLVLGDNQIYVRINSNTPCYAIAEIKLTLFSKPIITIQDIVPICENKTITIDAGAGFDSYLWSNGATTQTILVANPGNFSVTVTNDYDTISCSSTKSFVVKKSNKATINTIETKDWTDSDNMITVFATGNGDYEYSIDGFNYQTSNQFTGLISGKYTVLVRDKNGCGTATDEVYLLMFPRYFTPNGDGYNDTWKIKFSDMEAGLTVKIFDRYGKTIKVLNTSMDSWNGTYNGTDLPATDYWFIVTRANGIEYKGHFSLKR